MTKEENLTFSNSLVNEFTAANVICEINLSFDCSENVYKIDKEELTTIRDDFKRLAESASRKRQRNRERQATDNEIVTATVRTVAQPSTSDRGSRRSTKDNYQPSYSLDGLFQKCNTENRNSLKVCS